MSVTKYKKNGTFLSNICNAVNESYYGDVITKYKQNGVDIGTQLSLSTFSTVPGTITPCKYTANINQYKTGLNWTVSTGIPTTATWD